MEAHIAINYTFMRRLMVSSNVARDCLGSLTVLRVCIPPSPCHNFSRIKPKKQIMSDH